MIDPTGTWRKGFRTSIKPVLDRENVRYEGRLRAISCQQLGTDIPAVCVVLRRRRKKFGFVPWFENELLLVFDGPFAPNPFHIFDTKLLATIQGIKALQVPQAV